MNKEKSLVCGIIMPIASMGSEYPEQHWVDIRSIINRAVERVGFTPRMVSESDDATIIHKSIIQNIYNNPITICDVSGKNANVMFELGMRLAFNKPVVIIKDDLTSYSFDTSNIEHIGYRKDLRFNTIETFINSLAQKIKATYEKSISDNYQPFLSHFGSFTISSIDNQTIGSTEALEKLLDKVSILNENLDDQKLLTLNKINNSTNYSTVKFSKELNFSDQEEIARNTWRNYQNDVERISFTRDSFNIKWEPMLSFEDRTAIFHEIELFIENQINNLDDGLPF